MIEPPPADLTLQDATEWTIRALEDEGFPILLCGRGALDYQGEYTGSVDIDLLVGTDFRGAVSVLDAYQSRGDLDLGMGAEGVVRYLVRGGRPVDVLDVSSVHPRLFDLLRKRCSVPIPLGSAGEVRAVTREGYCVLAVMIGLRGFAARKRDPMGKVREALDLFGERVDRGEVAALLGTLGVRRPWEDLLRPPRDRR